MKYTLTAPCTLKPSRLKMTRFSEWQLRIREIREEAEIMDLPGLDAECYIDTSGHSHTLRVRTCKEEGFLPFRILGQDTLLSAEYDIQTLILQAEGLLAGAALGQESERLESTIETLRLLYEAAAFMDSP